MCLWVKSSLPSWSLRSLMCRLRSMVLPSGLALQSPGGGGGASLGCRSRGVSPRRTGRRAITPGLRDNDPLRAGPCRRQEVSAGLWDLHTPGRWCTGQSPCPVALSRLQCLSGLPQAGPGPRQLRTHLAEHRPLRGGVTAQECRKTVWGPGTEAWPHTKNVPCREIIMRLGDTRSKPSGCHQFCLCC